MKSTRKSWLGWMALALLAAGRADAQSPEYDPQTGSVRINGGDPYGGYRTDPAAYQGPGYGANPHAGPAGAPGFAPYDVYGGGYYPPQGVTLDPNFRAAAGLGGPALEELDRVQWMLYRVSGDVAGLTDGFTNVGALIPRRVFGEYNMFALNPRVLVSDEGTGGFNLGGIHRFYVPELDRMFGQSLWWDFSRTGEDNYNQFGYSAETVGRYVSFRANANIVIGSSQRVTGQTFSPTSFTENGIGLFVNERFNAPVDNYSFEAAYPMPMLGKYGVEWAAGGYFLTADGVDNAFGVSGRAQMQVTEDLWIQGLITQDEMFDTNVSVNFEYRFGNGKPSRIARPNPVVMSLTQSVQRNYQVKLAQGERTNFFEEVNPKDGGAFRVAHIDPNAVGNGSGTFSDPFGSVDAYMAAANRANFDIIWVQPNADGSDNDLDTGIEVLDLQRLLGNGTLPDGSMHQFMSNRGTFLIPGQTAGPLPVLSNVNAVGVRPPVVSLNGNVTEVAGFTIDAINGGVGIASNGAIDGFNINNNAIINAVSGIDITSNTATFLDCPGEDLGIIRFNTIDGVGFGGLAGVDIDHTGGTLGLYIADNAVAGFAGEDRDADGIIDASEDADSDGVLDPGEDLNGNNMLDLSEDVNGNALLDEGFAIDVDIQGGNVIADPSDDLFLPLGIVRNELSESGTGLRYTGRAGTTSLLDVQDNNAHDNLQNGLSFIADGGAIGFTQFQNNIAQLNGGDGGQWIADNNGILQTLTPAVGNDFSGNRRHGLFVSGDNGADMFFEIGDPDSITDLLNPENTFTFNGTAGEGGDGVHVVMTNGAQADFSGIYNSEITNNQGNGVTLDISNGTGGTTLNDFFIIGNSISNNGGDGVLVSGEDLNLNGAAAGNGFRGLLIANNTLSNNLLNGINFQLVNSDLVKHAIVGNTMDGNGLGGPGVPPGQSNFQIDVLFGGGLTATQQAIFAQASARWSQVITGDLADVGLIDDVEIVASGVAIDGPGGILGQAGPTAVRAGSFLPYSGIMQFDTADLATFEASGELIDIILHEMGHVIGIGTIWQNLGLLNGAGTADPRFTGVNATNEYNTRFGLLDPDVPVENIGGPGTADAHWRESIFNNELMTGFLNAGFNPLSRTTIGQLEDIGYQVNYLAADPYINAPNLGVTVDFETQFLHNVAGLTAPAVTTPSVTSPYISNLVTVDPTAIGNGINYSLDNSAIINGIVEDNTITNSTGDGIRMITPQFGAGAVPRSDIDFIQNDISSNVGRGVNIELDNANELEAVFRLNNISENVGGGIRVDLSDNAFFTTDTIVGGVTVDGFTNNAVSNNGSYGLHLRTDDNASFIMNLSRPGGSTFIGNTDANIFLDMNANSTGVFNISNTMVNGAQAGTLGQGDGLRILLRDQTDLDLVIGDPLLENTTFNSNAGAGLNIFIDDTATLVDALVQNSFFQNNGIDGIHVEREGDATIDNFRIGGLDAGLESLGNVITGNTDDGIELIARQADANDDYTIAENIISNNGNRGIHVRAEGDAEIFVDILFNDINENTSHGIQQTSIANNFSDNRSVTGNWLGNQINDNGADGINLGGTIGFSDGFVVPLQIGALGVDVLGRSFGNEIRGNAESGINITPFDDGANGFSNIVNNDIAENGQSGIDVIAPFGPITSIEDNRITENTLHGVNIQAIGGSGLVTANLERNQIRFNGGDGIQIHAASEPVTSPNENVFVTITDNNQVTDNGGRGIDILMAGTGRGFVQIDQTFVSRNDQEGIYSLITADFDQAVDALSSEDLTLSDDIRNDAFLDIILTNNTVTSNGSSGLFDGGGIVFRVGTTGGRTGANFLWTDPNTADPVARGGLRAQIDNNFTNNNFGIDFLIHTFASTVDPATTGGTWSDNNSIPRTDAPNPTGDNTFNPTGYEVDPLARILITSFIGNSGGSIDVLGAGLIQTADAQNHAFYDNNEAEFKSRTQNQDGNDPPNGAGEDDNGPFANNPGGTRRRNATRLPFRDDPLTPGIDMPPELTIIHGNRNSDDFLFPGTGLSTLRISAFSDLNAAGFTNVISNFNDILNIVNSGNPVGAIGTAYEWDTF